MIFGIDADGGAFASGTTGVGLPRTTETRRCSMVKSTAPHDPLAAWARRRVGGGGRPAPAATPAPVAPAPLVPAVRRDLAGNIVLEIPDAPRSPQRFFADSYQRLLSEVPDLMPDDQTGGVRVTVHPDEANLRGVPREPGWSDEKVRAYISERYGPENAGLISSPYDQQRPGGATAEEKAAWSKVP